MTEQPATHPNTVLVGLVLATFVSVLLNTSAAHQLLGASGAAVAAALIAFAMGRFIVSDFMALRGTGRQRPFDIWLLAVCGGSIALLLR